jgi:hypothetical protein
MIYIAHRGLMDGPSKELENRPDQIKKALNLGYDCEIDVRYIDGEWFLGHDNPDYPIDFNFLQQDRLWLHAKNLDALYVLGADPKLNFFWHQEDDFTLTSQGYIWTYPNKPLTKNSICVMPEWNNDISKNFKPDCYGICSDWVDIIVKTQFSDDYVS